MGRYSSSSEDDRRRSKKKKKSRLRSPSLESTDSYSSKRSKHKKSKKGKHSRRSRSKSHSSERHTRKRSRSRSRERRRRSRSKDRHRRKSRSRSRSFTRSRKSRSPSRSRSRRSTSRPRSRKTSRSPKRYRSRTRSVSRGRSRRSPSNSRGRSRRSRSKSVDAFAFRPDVKKEKDDDVKSGLELLSGPQQVEAKLQMALKAAAAADEKLREQSTASIDVLGAQQRARDIEAIENECFAPTPFKSQRGVKKEDTHEDAMFSVDFNADHIKTEKIQPTKIDFKQLDSYMHPNLFEPQEVKMERWKVKLANFRRSHLEGEAMS